MKKQQTKWIWKMYDSMGGHLKVGWIYNKKNGVLDDKVTVWMKSKTDNIRFNMRVWEAAILIAGLGKVLAVQGMNGLIGVVNDSKR